MKYNILIGIALILIGSGCAQRVTTLSTANDRNLYAVTLASYFTKEIYPRKLTIDSVELNNSIPVVKLSQKEFLKNPKWDFVFKNLPDKKEGKSEVILSSELLKRNDLKYYPDSFFFLFSPVLYSNDHTKAFISFSQYENKNLTLSHFIFLENINGIWSVADTDFVSFN